jgi:aryl-alcohol dehydrogenase-like predicted oxidoreductase
MPRQTQPINLGGTYTPVGTTLKLNRIGYGAIHLSGPMVWGPPSDRDAAIAVVREAVRCGVNHIDTSDYYGPHIANQILKEALYPYRADLTIVTKVGARRAADKSWPKALSRQELIDAVHDNLRNLGLGTLDIVNLRLGEPSGPDDSSVEEPLAVLAELKQQGLIRHIGLSNISRAQFDEGSNITKIVCVQNHYNLAHRVDDDLIDDLAAKQIAFVPFFPLGGRHPLNSPILDKVARSVGATTRQVALAWLLQRSPNILLIAGTSSVEHLHENFRVADLKLPSEAFAQLNSIGAAASRQTH